MRSLATLLGCALLFAGALYGGRAAISASHEAPPAQGDGAETLSDADGQQPSKTQAKNKKRTGEGKVGGGPKARPNARDNTIAEGAVVRSRDLLPDWRKGRPMIAGLRCPTNGADQSHLTMTGAARSAFQIPGSSAAITSSVQIFPNRASAREFFRLTATRAALTCMRRGIAKRLRENGGGSVLSAEMWRGQEIAEQTAVYTVVILSKDGQVAWPVDAVCFQFDRATGLVLFHNVANDKLNLTHSVVGRLFVALRDAQG